MFIRGKLHHYSTNLSYLIAMGNVIVKIYCLVRVSLKITASYESRPKGRGL
jgi:hypothetical protein